MSVLRGYKEISGKLYLIPGDEEIEKGSELWLRYYIDQAEKAIYQCQSEVEACERQYEHFKDLARSGNISADQSLSVANRSITEAKKKKAQHEKILSDLKVSLQIEQNREKPGEIVLQRNGEKLMSDWDFLTMTGTIDRFKQQGNPFTPIHDFNLLLEHRNEFYEDRKTKFLKDRELKHLETNDLELAAHRLMWLNGEIKSADRWLNEKNVSESDQIEIVKYISYIKAEINIATEIIESNKTIAVKNSGSTKETNALQNDFTLSTIEDFLEKFDSKMSASDYKRLISALKKYFETGKFPVVEKVNVGRVNKKAFGWALYEIYRALKTNNETLSKEYLLFAKNNISIFSNDKFNENNIQKSNLYKYFTTKTK